MTNRNKALSLGGLTLFAWTMGCGTSRDTVRMRNAPPAHIQVFNETVLGQRAVVEYEPRPMAPVAKERSARDISLHAGTLRFKSSQAAQTVAMPAEQVRFVEMRKPGSSVEGAVRGAGWGLPTGFVTGALLGLAANDDCNGCWIRLPRTDYALIYGVALALPSAAIGAAFGAITGKNLRFEF